MVPLPSIGPTAFLVSDTTFSPVTQGNRKLLDTLAAPTYEAVVALSGADSPLDGLRYAFVATSNNQIYATAYKQDSTRPEFGPVLVYDTPFPSYPPNSIVDIAAFFSSDPDPALDNQIYIAVLMANGDLWAIFGTHDVIGSWTAIGLLFAHAPQGKSICAYYSPQDQERHMLIATDHDISPMFTLLRTRHNKKPLLTSTRPFLPLLVFTHRMTRCNTRLSQPLMGVPITYKKSSSNWAFRFHPQRSWEQRTLLLWILVPM